MSATHRRVASGWHLPSTPIDPAKIRQEALDLLMLAIDEVNRPACVVPYVVVVTPSEEDGSRLQ